MSETTKRSGRDTLDVINALCNQGIDSLVVLLRHSNRHYDFEKLDKDAFFARG